MKHLGRYQTNSRVYWNDIYGNPVKAHEHKAESDRFTHAIEFIKDEDVVIDLGCGVAKLGRLINEKRLGCEVWGVDISDVVIQQNSVDYPGDKYRQGYIGALGFLPNDYFDVVFSGETLEHLDFPEDLFNDAHRILKSGGIFILTTPLENLIDSHEHMWSFTREDIKKLYEDNGFHDVEFDDLPDMERLMVIFARATK